MTRIIHRLRSDQRGITMTEMLTGMLVFSIIFGAILTMVEGSMRNQDRITQRVLANQRARPVLTRMIDALHSACVAPAITPIKAGSTSNQIQFLSKVGSAVSPTPDKKVFTFTPTSTGVTLTEDVYVSNGGSAPDWSYPTTPSLPQRTLLTGLGPGMAGSPSVALPYFRYYAYVNGVISTTPLNVSGPTGLTASDAAKTVQVDIAFASSTSSTVTQDPNRRITFTDSTTMRLEPASEDSAEVNLPCV